MPESRTLLQASVGLALDAMDTDLLVDLSVCAAVAAGGASSPPSLLATSSLEHAPAHTWNWFVSILMLVRVLALTICASQL